MAGDTANVWGDAELQIDPDPFFTSCKISSINKKARSKVPLKPKSPFKWVFMDVIPSTSPKSLTNDTNFNNYLLIVDPFCTSCKISSINKKARSKVPIKPKSPFKWVFMDVIPSTSPKSLT